MKWIIFISVLVLVLLSGCLDLVSTRQKQLCLSATHESQTSVFECSKTSDCFKKVDGAGLFVSNEINYNIKNQMLMYKNNISSAIYYFNKSRENIKKINEFCNGEKDVDIIKNINTLTFNLSKTFEYQDSSWQKSIELLKDYVIFLKENGVENISEEPIYDSYILINQNLNELRGEEQLSENYVSYLKIEAKRAQILAKKFGFTQSYMTEYGFVDLFSYYSEYIDNPKKEIKLPLISKSSNYVFAKFSTIENYLRINESLAEADGYNLYVLFDKEFGSNDSLFTKFITLNNEINKNIDLAYEKINEIENNILENIEQLNAKDKITFEKNKKKFIEKKIGFGHYLEILKEIELELNETEEMNETKQEEIKECDVIVGEAKKYNNHYFKTLVEIYETKEHLEKIDACHKIKIALTQKDCLIDYEKLSILGYVLENSENIDEFECIEILNQLNYNLEKDERIILFKKIILENYNYINKLEILELTLDEEITLLNYKFENDSFNISNYKIIKEYEENIKKINLLNIKIIKLFNDKIINSLEKEHEIVFENGGYYLVTYNYTDGQGEFCFDPKIPLDELESLDERLKINKKEICLKLNTGINKYQIKYKNQKTIQTKLIDLDLEYGLFETNVKNTCLGVYDSVNLGRVDVLDTVKYTIDNTNNIYFVTEKENKILYYKKIFEKRTITNHTSTQETNYLTINVFKVKNLTSEKICGNATILYDCYECVVLFKENEIIKPTILENGNLKSAICLEAYQEKTYELQEIKNYKEIENDILDLIIIINKMQECEFEEIVKLIKTKIKELSKYQDKKLNVEEINNFYKYKEDVELIIRKYDEFTKIIENTNLIIAKLTLLNLTEKEKKELENIENKKYKEPEKNYLEITKLYTTVLNRMMCEEDIFALDMMNKTKNLLENIKIAGVDDVLLLSKINNLELDPLSTDEYKKLEEEVNNKILERAEEINKLLLEIKEINVKEINNLIEEVNYLYSDVSLKELYDVKYYPIITPQDADRLNKKKEYLQTVTLAQNILKFQNNFSEKEYLKAIKGIDASTIERITDINKEYALLKNGMTQIEKDSLEEIKILENKFLKPSNDIKIKIEKIKEFQENKKYLLAIKEARKTNPEKKEKIKINYQLFVMSGILLISYISYTKLNKKKKKITKEEKKQKILREY